MCKDEAMLKYKGHIKGKVCMPKKPIRVLRFGAIAAPVVGTSVHFRCIRVSPWVHPQESRYQRRVKRVVMELVSPFSGLYHVLYLDTFFTSGPLVEELYEELYEVACTIQQRAAGFPNSLNQQEGAMLWKG